MDLLCIEAESCKKAFEDPNLLKNERVLVNMLAMEDRYLPSPSYFRVVQPEIKPFMRKIVSAWMLEVCEEQRCEEEVFVLSMNYMDRFLSVVPLKKNQLQLLGAVCMFIASKLKENLPLTAEKLVIYTANSVTLKELMEWELFVLKVLKWDISAITPHDFLEQILIRLPVDRTDANTIKRHAQTFIALCATEFKFAMNPPSMVAAASVCAATSGLRGPSWCHDIYLIDRLQKITGIDADCLRACQEQIEEALQSFPQETAPSPNGTSSAVHPMAAHSKCDGSERTTPTDVREVQLIS